MQIQFLPDPQSFERMTNRELRNSFLLDDLFAADKIVLHYVEIDRAIVGSALPVEQELRLKANKETMAAQSFCERRELGVINIGGEGRVTVDDRAFVLQNSDGLYIGRGSKEISFSSIDSQNPAQFYLLSYPAHALYPTTFIRRSDAEKTSLGSKENANQRVIEKYIHPGGVKSAQLVMGITRLQNGSVWNTLPPHTHQRRTEVYFYFDLEDDNLVFHFCGKPNSTKHIVVRNRQAVISPSWSIHAGVGSRSYAFIWGMGGENQDFSDMDQVPLKEIF